MHWQMLHLDIMADFIKTIFALLLSDHYVSFLTM